MLSVHNSYLTDIFCWIVIPISELCFVFIWRTRNDIFVELSCHYIMNAEIFASIRFPLKYVTKVNIDVFIRLYADL